MRILHVTHTIHARAGGPPTVAVNLAAAQSSLGHSVTVVGHFPRDDEQGAHSMFKNIPFETPLQHHLLPSRGTLSDIIGTKVRQLMYGLLKETDILIAHGLWDCTILHSAWMAQELGIPYVIRPAGTLDPWSLQQKRWKKMLSLRLVHEKMLGKAAFIHATSAEEATNVSKLLASRGISLPVHVIPNGIFLQDIELQPEKGSFYNDHPELKGHPFIAFLGRLHHKNAPILLVQAFAALADSLPDLRLVVAGPDEGEAAKVAHLVEKLGLSKRVHLLGPIYGRKKFELLADAACFCLPSEQENFGVAVAEAMASGTPAVVSDQVQIWPQIQRAGAGLAFPLQVEALAAALKQVLSDEDARVKMGLAGRKLVEDMYLWRKIAKLSIEHYEDVLPQTRDDSALQNAIV